MPLAGSQASLYYARGRSQPRRRHGEGACSCSPRFRPGRCRSASRSTSCGAEPSSRRVPSLLLVPCARRLARVRDVRIRLVSELRLPPSGRTSAAGRRGHASLVAAALIGWGIDSASGRTAGSHKLVQCLEVEKGLRARDARDPIAQSAELGALRTVIETNRSHGRGREPTEERRADRRRLPRDRGRARGQAGAARPARLPLGSSGVADAAADDVRLHLLSRRSTLAGRDRGPLHLRRAARRHRLGVRARRRDDRRDRRRPARAGALPRRSPSRSSPRVDDPGYVPALAALVAEHDVKLIVPLTDLDQMLLAQSRDALAPALAARPRARGLPARWATSTSRTCSSRRTGSRARAAGCPSDVPDDARYPLLVKVREGFGSRHIYRAQRPRRARLLPRLHDGRLVRAGAAARARSSPSTSSATSRAAA